MNRKRVAIIIILIIALALFGLYNSQSEDKQIKARIIPNSNETSDILLKEEMVIDVKEYLLAEYSSDYLEYISNIENSYQEFNAQMIEKYGEVKIMFKEHTLYNKTYNDSALKNENSMTLLVIIGEGLGDNWWGTVYPTFLAQESTEEIEYKSFIEKILEEISG